MPSSTASGLDRRDEGRARNFLDCSRVLWLGESCRLRRLGVIPNPAVGWAPTQAGSAIVPLLCYLGILLTVLPSFSFTAQKMAPLTGQREQAVAGVCIVYINSLCNFAHSLENIWAQQNSQVFFCHSPAQ